MAESTTVSGLAELHKAMQQFSVEMETKITRNGIRAGMREIQKIAQAGVPVKSGKLRRSIRVSTSRKSLKNFGWIRAYLNAGGRTAWYAHIVEFGSASHYQGKGKSIGKPYTIKGKNGGALALNGSHPVMSVTHPGVRPRAFMRRALDSGHGPALAKMASKIRSDVERMKLRARA